MKRDKVEAEQLLSFNQGDKQYKIATAKVNGRLDIALRDESRPDKPIYEENYSIKDLQKINNIFLLTNEIDKAKSGLENAIEKNKIKILQYEDHADMKFFSRLLSKDSPFVLKLPKRQETCTMEDERLEELEQKKEDLKKEQDKLRKEVFTLKLDENDYLKKAKKTNKKKKELEGKNEELSSLNDILKEKLKKLKEKNELLKQNNDKLKKRKIELEERIANEDNEPLSNADIFDPENSDYHSLPSIDELYDQELEEIYTNEPKNEIIPEPRDSRRRHKDKNKEKNQNNLEGGILRSSPKKKKRSTGNEKREEDSKNDNQNEKNENDDDHHGDNLKSKELKGGKIIKSQKELNFLTEKIGKKKQKVNLTLIYKASRDSDKAKAFHNKCDEYQKTLVLVESKKGARFGGYTTQSWEGNCSKNDPEAFIFSLNKLFLFQVPKRSPAIICDPLNGPIFSRGVININDNAFKNGGTTIEDFPALEDYELTRGEKKFSVKEIEVYAVE